MNETPSNIGETQVQIETAIMAASAAVNAEPDMIFPPELTNLEQQALQALQPQEG